jgi:hypothetical protein
MQVKVSHAASHVGDGIGHGILRGTPMPDDKDREPFFEKWLARGKEFLRIIPTGIPAAALQPENACAIRFLGRDGIKRQGQSIFVPVNDVRSDTRLVRGKGRHSVDPQTKHETKGTKNIHGKPGRCGVHDNRLSDVNVAVD